MSSISVSASVFACVFGGALIGIFLGGILPKTHLDGASKDVVRLATALVVTITALVLSLLIAAAKGSYDQQSADVAQASAKIVLLDRVLSVYGPETKEVRDRLRDIVVFHLDRIWPQEHSRTSKPQAASVDSGVLYLQIEALSPKDNIQRRAQTQASSLAVSLGEIRWLMYAQATHSVSKPMLVILVFWLTAIFISFGLYAPTNATVITALSVSALTVSCGIFLLLEFYAPFSGVVAVSSAPLRNALAQIGQ